MLKHLAAILGSLRFALGVVVLIALACVAGTLLPQGQQQVERYLEHFPERSARMEFLGRLGLTGVFYSWWFIALLCILTASLVVCTFRRYLTLRRTAGAQRLRVLGSLITHLSLLLILAGGVARAVWGEKGYIELREGQPLTGFDGQRGPVALPFAVRLEDFELEFYPVPGEEGAPAPAPAAQRLVVTWPERGLSNEFPVAVGAEYAVAVAGDSVRTAGTFRVSIKRYVPDFVIDRASRDVRSRSEEPNNPAILLSLAGGGRSEERWIFARYPEFKMHSGGEADGIPLKVRFEAPLPEADVLPARRVKDYKSHLTILSDGQAVREKVIEVNAPLSYGGYTFYQFSYDPGDLTVTTLQVVRDPGVTVVYAGFILMMIGLTIVFWIAPSAAGRRGEGAG